MRTALVSGGSAGIGLACVERLRADGYAVAFTARDAARGAAVATRLGATFIAADAADRAAADRSVATAQAALGSIGLLVASAGLFVTGRLTDTPDPVFGAQLETNLTAPFRYARAVFGLQQAAGGGSICVIAADAAIRGSHLAPGFSVTRAGAIAVAELFGAEGAPHGIRANAICPGPAVPPPAVANAVAWLASDEARHVNGATLRIDGGATAALIPVS